MVPAIIGIQYTRNLCYSIYISSTHRSFTMQFSRRDFLKASVATAAIAAIPGNIWAQQGRKRPIQIGVQLYSVRGDAEKDLLNVLKTLSGYGYQGVEFAGYYGHSAEEIKKMLDEAKIVCCGTHAQYASLQDDVLEETIAFNKTIGNRLLIVPSLPGDALASAEAVQKTAKWFNSLAEKLKPHGMFTGYHAHAGDFEKLPDGKTKWDLLFELTSKPVVMQIDIGNCMDGGGDPIAVIKKFPGRAKSVHLKEHGGEDNAVIGNGDAPLKEAIELCKTIGGTRWFVVEQERYPEGLTPLEACGQCLENAKKAGSLTAQDTKIDKLYQSFG